MYEIAVCDDCAKDRTWLISQINQNGISEQGIRFHEYGTGQDLLDDMEYMKFDVIFLDIQMEGMDGNTVAREIRMIDMNLVLVFYTGFVEPSPVSFEVQPYRYIMKNVNKGQMAQCINDILLKMIESSNSPSIEAHIGKRKLFIKAEHIIYIEKYKKDTRAHITERAYNLYGLHEDEDGNYPDIHIRNKLKDTYEILKMHGFGWPHDSYIINLNYMCSCTGKTFRLVETEGSLQIARSKAETFHTIKDKFLCSKYVDGGAL